MRTNNGANFNNGSAGGAHSREAQPDRVLAPTWSVRETRRQFEQMGAGPPMSNSFSGDLRSYKGRYAKPLAEVERQRFADPDNIPSFDAIKLNEGPSAGKRHSNDDNLNRYHPHNQPMSYNFQRAVQQHTSNDGFNTVAQYYPNSTHRNNFGSPNSFQAPRLISQSNSVSASRPPTYESPSSTSPYQNNHDGGPNQQETNWTQNDYHPENAKNSREIRTVVAVPETDILDDSNYSETEDELVAGCADENHTRDGSINSGPITNYPTIHDNKRTTSSLLDELGRKVFLPRKLPLGNG